MAGKHLRTDKQSRFVRCITPILAGSVMVISLVVLVQWLSGFFQSGGTSIKSVPMAPMTSILLLLIGTALLLQRQLHAGRVLSGLIRTVSVFVLLVSSYLVLQHFISALSTDIEGFLTASTVSASGFVIGRMSLITAILFILVSISLFISTLQRERPDRLFSITDVLTLSVFVAALIILSGYWYKAPLFYGGTIIPVALRSAIGFLLVSAAQLFNKPEDPFYRFATSPSITAQICRRILPISILIVLAGGYSEEFFSGLIGPSMFPAAHVGLTLAVVVVIILIVSTVSGRVEHDIAQKEEVLQQSERRYSTLVEKGSDGVIVLQDGLVKFANSRAIEITGLSREEVRGKPFTDFVTPLYRELMMERHKKRVAGESVPDKYESEILNKDGSGTPIEVNASMIEYDGKPAVLGMVRDITERKLAETQLIESEVRHRSILQTAMDGIWSVDLQGRLREVNESYCRMSGYSEQELLTMSVSDLEVLESDADTSEHIKRVFEKGEDRFETKHRRKDGTIFNVEVSAQYQPSYAGSLVVFLRDITERKGAEETLKLQADLLDLESDSVDLHDFDGNILYANKAFYDTIGYTREEISTSRLYQLSDPESVNLVSERLKELSEKGKITFNVNHRHKDGSWVPMEIHASLTEVGGRVLVLSVGHNISERLKLQEQLMAQDRLVSIGQLVSGVAHEINNPLTGVIGFSELLLTRKDLPDDAKADLKIINDEAHRTAKIVQNLLTFSRQHTEGKAPLNIHDTIDRVLALRAHEQTVNNIKVNTHFAPDLPQVEGSSSQLQQVFFNLAINAEQAMLEANRKGTMTVTTMMVGDKVRVSIADDGPGISSENMQKLFTPFFTTKEVGKGTGLGLSISHGIITAHGGRIYVESELGKGATFIVELPIKKEQEDGRG